MIRKMMNFKRRDAETLEAFMERSNVNINDQMASHGILPWDVVARRNIFKWAGWVSRLRVFDPDRITLKVSVWSELGVDSGSCTGKRWSPIAWALSACLAVGSSGLQVF